MGRGRVPRDLLPDIEWVDSAIGWRDAILTVGLVLLCGLAAGSVVFHNDTVESRRIVGNAASGARERRPGSQVAHVRSSRLSLVLTYAAFLVLASLENLQRIDTGFDAERLLIAEMRFDRGETAPPAVISQEITALAESPQSCLACRTLLIQ